MARPRITAAAVIAAAAMISTTIAFTPSQYTSRIQNTRLQSTTMSEAEQRAKAAIEAEESASKQQVQVGKQADQMMSGGRPFPLSMVVGQEPIKQALLLSSINNFNGW